MTTADASHTGTLDALHDQYTACGGLRYQWDRCDTVTSTLELCVGVGVCALCVCVSVCVCTDGIGFSHSCSHGAEGG